MKASVGESERTKPGVLQLPTTGSTTVSLWIGLRFGNTNAVNVRTLT